VPTHIRAPETREISVIGQFREMIPFRTSAADATVALEHRLPFALSLLAAVNVAFRVLMPLARPSSPACLLVEVTSNPTGGAPEQVPDGRDVPASTTRRPNAPAVQGAGNGSEPARPGGPDLQHDRKHVGGKPVGLSPPASAARGLLPRPGSAGCRVSPLWPSWLRAPAGSVLRSDAAPSRRARRRGGASACAPSSATIKGTRWAMRPATKATSRERRSSLATTTGHFFTRASANAAASCGRRSSASAPCRFRPRRTRRLLPGPRPRRSAGRPCVGPRCQDLTAVAAR
jgi:hypothetical protein